MDRSRLFIILTHAFVGWMLCAATMGIGLAVASIDRVLVVHAIAAVSVSVESGFLTKETAGRIIQKAYANMNALSAAVSAVKPETLAPSQPPSSEPPAEGKG